MAREFSLLQRELKQTRPFSSVFEEAALSVLKTADMIRRDIARRLDPHGITVQQYNVLRILRGAGPQGIATLCIGDRLIEETPGMTRLLDRLEAKGLVRRHRCEKDRRQVLCYITGSGMDLLSTLDPTMAGTEKRWRELLTPEEAELLVQYLERIREQKQ